MIAEVDKDGDGQIDYDGAQQMYSCSNVKQTFDILTVQTGIFMRIYHCVNLI